MKAFLHSCAATLMMLLTTSFFSSATLAAGHESSGGGNGLSGQPIESFSIYPTSLDAYQQVVLPLLDLLETRVPGFAERLRAVTEDKVWYLVPTKLEELNRNQTGVPFVSDQIAIQTARSVWIGGPGFANMNVNAQGTLILHELLLGVYFTENLSRPFANRELNGDDLDLVRMMTVKLPQMLSKDTSETMVEKIKKLGFGKYEPATDSSRFPEFKSPSDFLSFLQIKIDRKELPTIYSWSDNGETSGCAYRAAPETDGSIRIDGFYAHNGKPTSLASSVKTAMPPLRYQIRNDLVTYLLLEGQSWPQAGEVRKGLYLRIDGNQISTVGFGSFRCPSNATEASRCEQVDSNWDLAC